MRALIIALFAITILSCSKQPTTWDTNQRAPLVKANLGLSDIIPDSIIQVNDDQTVGIRFQRELLSFRIDSLVEIPTDTVEKEFSIAPLIQYTFDPGQTFYHTNDQFEFDNLEAQLSEAIIKDGVLHFHAENTIASPLDFELDIPGASLDGETLHIESTVPPATSDQNGYLDLDIDVSDYTLDLSGSGGFGYNSLSVNFRLTIPEDSEPVTVYNTDFVSLQLTYSELEMAFARGYIGTYNENVDQSTTLSDFRKFNDAILDLENSSAQMKFSNGFGVDIQADIFQLKGWNTSKNTSLALTGSLIGSTINLSRATYPNERIIPFEKVFDLNSGNSNIDEMLELLPDSIHIFANVAVNPFGNISNYNDFVSYQSTITASLDAYIPLTLSLSNISLRDTAAFEFGDDADIVINSGKLYLAAANGFPANITLSLQALSDDNTVLINLNEYSDGDALVAGRTDSIPAQSVLRYTINAAAMTVLKHADKIAIKADFETTNYPDRMTFTSRDSLSLLISSDINTTFNF